MEFEISASEHQSVELALRCCIRLSYEDVYSLLKVRLLEVMSGLYPADVSWASLLAPIRMAHRVVKRTPEKIGDFDRVNACGFQRTRSQLHKD